MRKASTIITSLLLFALALGAVCPPTAAHVYAASYSRSFVPATTAYCA